MIIKTKLDEGAYFPERAYMSDAGADLRTPKRIMIAAHERITINTGIHVSIPDGYAGFIKSKSGLMKNDGIIVDGLIDSGFDGSIHVCMFNTSHRYKIFNKGDKIAQLVIVPIDAVTFEQVEAIAGGERGQNGFGSTGR